MTSVVDDRSGGRAPLDPGWRPAVCWWPRRGCSDPNFRRTVVYVIEHRDRGTLGVVLNRPSEVSVGDVLPSWAPLAIQPHAVFVGGPVESQTALCLAAVRTGRGPGGAGRVGGGAGPGGAGRPRRRPGAAHLPAARPARLRRLLRAGTPVSSRPRSGAATGSWCPPSPTTSSPATTPTCGAACCAARACRSRCWPPTPPTCGRTEPLAALRALDAAVAARRRRPAQLARADGRGRGRASSAARLPTSPPMPVSPSVPTRLTSG